MSLSKQNTEQSSSSDKIKKNPFFDDFVDCIENLPSRLQLLLTELRNIDVLVKTRHRKLNCLKQEIISKSQENNDQETLKNNLDSLFNKMHQLLIQCQTLGDQKIQLSSQIIEMIGSKTRQLGLDPRTNEAKFHLEIDEDKILNEFRLTCKKNRPIHHHYNAANSSVNSRSSTRNFHNLTKTGHKHAVDIGRKVYNKKSLNLQREVWNDDNPNIEHSPQNSFHQLNGHSYLKKKPLNQPSSAFSDAKKSLKKSNEIRNNIDNTNQLTTTRPKRHHSFCKTSSELAKKSLNQSLKISRKHRLSLSKKPQSSGSSSSSHQCKSPSSISSFSSISSCKNKYLTNNTNNGNHSSNLSSHKIIISTVNQEKAQKENIKLNAKSKSNKFVKRLGVRGNAKNKKSDDDDANQEDSEYESDDEKSAETDNEDLREPKNIQIKTEIKEDLLERNSNETESIKNLDEEENEPNNETEEERPVSRSKRIKQEVDYSDDIRKKSTRITRNNQSETVPRISKSAHDEPLYCVCREISYGQMIMCDNDACQIEWFHFNCVKLSNKPKGKWYCPLCRGDTHKVMKKNHLIQSSASSNLSSPSYYTSNNSNRCK